MPSAQKKHSAPITSGKRPPRSAAARVVKASAPDQTTAKKRTSKKQPAKSAHVKTGAKTVKKSSRATPEKGGSKKPAATKGSPTSSWTLHVSLSDTKPLIWRRFVVPGTLTLGDLADVLRVMMSWSGAHLHGFRIGKTEYGPARLADDDDMIEHETSVTIAAVLPKPKSKLLFVYDYGDDWRHEVVVEKISPTADESPRILCLAGDRAAPPEDCGGIWGFSEILRLFSNPTLSDPEGMREWIQDYDPAKVDLDLINETLARLRC